MDEPLPGQGVQGVQDTDLGAMGIYAPLAGTIEEVAALVVRGRHGWHQPVVSLVSSDDGTSSSSALRIIGRALGAPEARRRVPHVRVDTSKSTDVRELLAQVSEGLAAGHFGPDHRLRFRHFDFVRWLLRVKLAEDASSSERQRELASRLRQVSQLRIDAQGPRILAGWSGFVLWLVGTIVPAIIFRVLLSGRLPLPGAGQVFRWLMRQDYGPQDAGNFLAFAAALTQQEQRDPADEERINRLLVHAFLQDLRVQFRRRLWRVREWRRTAGPVVLLDRVAPDSVGEQLLHLINTVRTETQQDDPLLVIAARSQLTETERAADAGTELVPLASLVWVLKQWRSHRVRKSRPPNWQLGVFLPDTAAPGTIRQHLFPEIRRPRPPLLASRPVLTTLVLLPLVVPGVWLATQWHLGCFPVHLSGRVQVTYAEDQCIGYSDSPSQVFGTDADLRQLQHRIFEQNREAEQAWTVKNDRPFVSLVYFGTLTKPNVQHNEETFAAEREELEGIAAAQYRANKEAELDRNAPFVTVLVANAGAEMRSAEKVADLLLHSGDSSVIGVLGLVESRTWTVDAMRALNVTGLPVVAPTLSADGIGEESDHYLQLAPPNVDQARMIWEYSTGVAGTNKLYNYYTYGAGGREGTETDLYVNTLRTALQREFENGGGEYVDKYWSGRELDDVCADQYDGVVFFGGRYSEFGAFLNQLSQQCSGRLPILLGDDSVNRYMANFQEREIAPTNFPVSYVSKGALAFCNKLFRAADSERKNFLNDVQAVLGRCGPADNSPVGERVGLAYDATRLLLREVRKVAAERPEGSADRPWETAALYSQVRRTYTAENPYLGVTGPIIFGSDGIVLGKRLSLLCAPNVNQAFRSANTVPYEVYGIGLTYPEDFAITPQRCG